LISIHFEFAKLDALVNVLEATQLIETDVQRFQLGALIN
jgi:hypothetical protein